MFKELHQHVMAPPTHTQNGRSSTCVASPPTSSSVSLFLDSDTPRVNATVGHGVTVQHTRQSRYSTDKTNKNLAQSFTTTNSCFLCWTAISQLKHASQAPPTATKAQSRVFLLLAIILLSTNKPAFPPGDCVTSPAWVALKSPLARLLSVV